MKLEWDDVKNEANIKKHGIDFVVFIEQIEDVIRIISARKEKL